MPTVFTPTPLSPSISQETKVGKVILRDDNKEEVHIRLTDGTIHVISYSDFDAFLDAKKDIYFECRCNVLTSKEVLYLHMLILYMPNVYLPRTRNIRLKRSLILLINQPRNTRSHY